MNKVRSTLSEKNPLQISKHRYYELRHWCLQYPEWKTDRKRINSMKSESILIPVKKGSELMRRTEDCAEKLSVLNAQIDLVEQIADEAGQEISKWLKIGVTEDKSFTELKTLYEIPCERDMYYRCYRLFFALLSERKR